MSKREIKDLKKAGVLQDVKELKGGSRRFKEPKQTYVPKPNEKKYQKAYRKADSPEVAKRISENYEQQERAYANQRADILSGKKPSKAKYVVNRAVGNLVSGIQSYSNQRVISRGVLKKNNMTYKVRQYTPDNILAHQNKFFKNELANEKRSLFFS